MPDLDHLRIDGTTYDLKDSTAREKDAVQDNELNSVKSALNELPKIAETEEDNADLYISDSDGNVLSQFSNGHIQTKYFNSENVGDLSNLDTTNRTNLVEAINEVKSNTVENAPSVDLTNATSSLDISDSQGNVLVRFEEGHVKTKYFDSSEVKAEPPIQFKFSAGNLLLAYGYNNTNDAVVVFNIGRANNLFDFSAFCLIPKGACLNDYERGTLTEVWTSATDMHSPFQFLAVNNPDGYYASATDPSYTGGNHTQTIDGTVVKTASSKYVHYFSDGTPVSSGYGKCTHFEIRWANNVQAYNCVKLDGTGRTSMVEHHDMVFDGVRFEENAMLVPTEDIKMDIFEGFATVGWNSVYTKIQFIDAINRGIYSSSDGQAKSGNNAPSGMILSGDTHSLEMRIDTSLDLGKREHYSGDGGAFTESYGKAYFRLISTTVEGMVTMPKSNAFYYRGSYRFFPTVQ